MPTWTLRPSAGGFCLLLLLCCSAGAQEGSAPATLGTVKASEPKAPDATFRQVEEIWPSVTWMPDKDGNLQPVVGFSYEQFMELYRLKEQLTQQDQRPGYSIQQLSASGTCDAEHVELTIHLKITLREKDWVRVPLHMPRALLRQPVAYQGPGEHFLHFEESVAGRNGGEGYVCWLRGPAGGQHELTLTMLVPLMRIGDETRLKLEVPNATVSELKLRVPLANAVARVSEGARLEPPAAAGDGATEFTARGIGGDFELNWSEGRAQAAERLPVLKVEGTVQARIEKLRVDTTAKLLVSSFNAPFDQFQVRLPEGADLLPPTSVGYTVEKIEPRMVVVRLEKKTSGPVEINLATTRAVRPNELFNLAGFDVVSAERQSGHIDVAADRDWQVLWSTTSGIARVEPSRFEGVVAGFDYFMQPYALTAQLTPRETHISVEPECLLLVGADKVRLEATLKYTIRGPQAYSLEVALPEGWTYDRVEPEELVDVEQVSPIRPNVLSIPLLRPAAGKIQLRIHAYWPIPEGTRSLTLPLPQPQVNSPGPAVVVLPDDDVELTPDHEKMVGLTAQQVDPQMQLPVRQQTPLFYRGEATNAVFAADFLVHAQNIAVDVTSQVSLDGPSTAVQQKLAYTVKYKPADHFTLEVPRELAEPGRLQLQYAGQPLPPPSDVPGVRSPGEASAADDPPTVLKQIVLPAACIGPCELTVRYAFPVQEIRADRQTTVSIPLLMPGEGELLGNRVIVGAVPEINVATSRGPWVLAEPSALNNGAAAALRLSADARASSVDLDVGLENGGGKSGTVVERAWVQTWLTEDARQDRAVFSLTTDRKELQLTVPQGAAADQVEIWLDGKQVSGWPGSGGRLAIALSEEAGHRNYTLDLRFHFPRQRPGPGNLSLEFPQWGEGVWVRRLYWQLVLPHDEHVLTAPEGFTSENVWNWEDCFWGRKPLLGQAEMEAWVGATGDLSDPGGTNHYLFSTMGNVSRGVVRTADRFWIVLIASGATLVAGLILIYLPVSRHPAVLFALAVALLCVGTIYPEPTLLVAQAASLGLVMTLVAGLLQRGVARRRQAVTLLETASSILEKGSTQSQFQTIVPGSHVSTQSSPAVAPPSPDPNA